jgi:DNA-binding NtrC family response regulator/tetratricopeptide (TPR) repeat protein
MPKSAQNPVENLNAKLSLIEKLLEKGNFKQALAEINEMDDCEESDQFSAKSGELSYLEAFTLDKLGKTKQALASVKKAYEILRDTGKNQRLAQIQQLMGRIYVKLGDLKSAEIQFTDTASTYRRIKDKKGTAETYNELARVCFIRSEFSRAVGYIEDALEFCQEAQDRRLAANLYGNLGTVLMLNDQWGKAQENLLLSFRANEALGDDFNVCKSLLSLGYLSCLLRKFNSAEEYLDKAFLFISGNNYLRELAIFHEYRGSLDMARGELNSARTHFLEAIRIGEQIAPRGAIIGQAYRLLAELQMEQREFEEASLSCEKSIQASKETGERLEEAAAYRTLGRIYSQNGHPADAKKNFDQVIPMLEEMGARFELGKTYLFMGECDSYSIWERMKFLGRAEDCASRLDTPYYLAKVHSGFAELFLQENNLTAAKDFLEKAKSEFEKQNDKQNLKLLSDLEERITTKASSYEPVTVSYSSDGSFAEMITQDKVVLGILESAKQFKDLDISILLEGGTGTGKDLLAKVIHYNSNRKSGKFMVVSCAALPEGLFESELFGYKKGAFTGAVADKKGMVDEASGGTLYLDEITDVPLSIQVKLLRAIEEKEIVRLGEVKPRKVDFRVIAATNRDMDELVTQGKFRNDLFYRLNGIRFKLPSLKDRKGDIPLLVEHFLKKFCASGISKNQPADAKLPSTVPSVDPEVMELLVSYQWPGNVRELENCVKQMFISCKGEQRITQSTLAGMMEMFSNGRCTEEDSLVEKLKQYQKEEIEKALTQTNGVKAQAARTLGIDEAVLRYKIKTLGITFPVKPNS